MRFADNQQLMNICQRIVSQVGRRVDEIEPDLRRASSRRLARQRHRAAARHRRPRAHHPQVQEATASKLEQLAKYGTISNEGKTILDIIGRVRCNVLISGGTGSGKTTLLNCLTGSIEDDERIITCEDSAELQLQQPHVVRLETRPPNLEGEGEIKMRDLVKNCLRMRPERIIVGEVRGPEAFDLLQAMNTGHDGSMGTLHSNSPREAISRLESMIMMGGYQLPVRTIREMITGSVDVIVQVARLRDGSRKVTHITEVLGMEGDVVTLQNLIVYDITGEDANGTHSRPPPLHRHRAAALLGPRRILRRRGQARRGAGRVRGAGRKRQSARRQECLRRTLLSFAAAMLAALAVGALAYACPAAVLFRRIARRTRALKERDRAEGPRVAAARSSRRRRGARRSPTR